MKKTLFQFLAMAFLQHLPTLYDNTNVGIMYSIRQDFFVQGEKAEDIAFGRNLLRSCEIVLNRVFNGLSVK